MEKSLIFWLLMFFIFLGWLFGGYSLYGNPDRRFFGAYLGVGFLQFLLFLVIGLALFGAPVK